MSLDFFSQKKKIENSQKKKFTKIRGNSQTFTEIHVWHYVLSYKQKDAPVNTCRQTPWKHPISIILHFNEHTRRKALAFLFFKKK